MSAVLLSLSVAVVATLLALPPLWPTASCGGDSEPAARRADPDRHRTGSIVPKGAKTANERFAGAEDTLPVDQKVVGIYYKGEARAYAHNILDWHEIVNDIYDEDNIVLSYCPLTGSAMAWKVGENRSVSDAYYGV